MKFSKKDYKRWGWMILIGAAVGAVNAIVGDVLPDIEGGGGHWVTLTMVLTIVADFTRKWLMNKKEEKNEIRPPSC